MRRLQNAQQHRRPDRTNRGNLAEPFPGLLFLTLGEQISAHFLAQRSQCIELLVIKFSPPAHPEFVDLAEPLGVGGCGGATRHDGTAHKPACRYKKWPNSDKWLSLGTSPVPDLW